MRFPSGWLALTLLALALRASGAAAKLEVIDLRQAGERHLLAANECAAKGQEGSCNGCVCCCFSGGAGIVSYQPTNTCTCTRVIKSSTIWQTVVLSVIVVLTGLLVQLYFGGSLPRSPYPTPEQQAQRAAQQAQRAQRARSRSSGRVSPEDSAALQESPLRSQYPPAAIVATSPARP